MDRLKTMPAPNGPALRAELRADELRRLGEQLFAEVRQEHAKDEAALSASRSQWPEILGGQLAKLCKGDGDATEIDSACDGGFCGD